MSVEDRPMLDVQPQKIDGRLDEDSGGTPENVLDSVICDQAATLESASAIAAAAARDARSNGWNGDWLLLLQALAQLTEDQAHEGDPAPIFTAERLRQEVASIVGAPEAQWWLEESDNARKKFANAWKALSSDIERLTLNLEGRAQKKNVPARVGLAPATKLGTSNAMGYGLTLIELALPKRNAPLRTPAISPPAQEALSIQYQEEMEVYPIPGIKRPLRISLPGYRAMVVALPLVAFLLIGGLLLWFLLMLWVSDADVRTIFRGTVVALLIAGMVGWCAYPFYRLIKDKIIPAPSLLELTLPLGHVLVLRHEENDRVLRMVRYTAKCPICEGSVSIEPGRRAHRGRLVGECARNPVEHVFSFDFVTRLGQLF